MTEANELNSTQRALEALDRVCESPYTETVGVDAEYRQLLEIVRAMSQNQPGTDKTWVEESHLRWLAHYRAARRIER